MRSKADEIRACSLERYVRPWRDSDEKRLAIREAIEASGTCVLFLMPYSPDFNPIEMAFSNIKSLLKKAAARSVQALWDAIRDAIDAVTPKDARSFFTACGYEPK